MSNRYFFDELNLSNGTIVAEGYAVIRPGSDWTIEDIFAGNSSGSLSSVSDPRLFSLISEALERDYEEEITAQFGNDLNAGLRRAA